MATGYWPEGFHPVANQAFAHGDAAHGASQGALDSRQPSAHQRAMAMHLAAAEAHRQAAGMLHKQVAGTAQAKQLEHHHAMVQKHLDWARLHNDLANRPGFGGDPKLTYGPRKTPLTYGPGAPRG